MPGAKVQIGRPEAMADQDASPVVNLYLYQATPNLAGRNATCRLGGGGPPARSERGGA